MDISTWVSVQRDDGETVGYLDPADPEYTLVTPRNVLGHAVADACGYLDGEQLLLERGISEVMTAWVLDSGSRDATELLTILEVSPHGIVLANALQTKALQPTERIHVPWPDVQHRLAPGRP
ncbi:hypothetical protein [Glutamicibacter protophormiae]|uniref:hypothetical protein n=1 Tax=Glutamicibacter protophormiae TaxID=37930 RepID=UPI00331DF8F3